MAINIPMPGSPGDAFAKGIESGRGLFQQMLQKKLLPYQIAEYERQQAMTPYEQALKQAQTSQAQAAAQLSQYKSDPQKQMELLRQMLGIFGGGMAQTPTGELQAGQEQAAGGGVGVPSGVSQQPQQGQYGDVTSPQAVALSQIMNRSFGIDPFEPERKFQEFKRQKEYEESRPTQATRSANQQQLQYIKTVRPEIARIKKIAPKTVADWANPNVMATYRSAVRAIPGLLSAALAERSTDPNIQNQIKNTSKLLLEKNSNFESRMDALDALLVNIEKIIGETSGGGTSSGATKENTGTSKGIGRFNPATGEVEYGG